MAGHLLNVTMEGLQPSVPYNMGRKTYISMAYSSLILAAYQTLPAVMRDMAATSHAWTGMPVHPWATSACARVPAV